MIGWLWWLVANEVKFRLMFCETILEMFFIAGLCMLVYLPLRAAMMCIELNPDFLPFELVPVFGRRPSEIFLSL